MSEQVLLEQMEQMGIMNIPFQQLLPFKECLGSGTYGEVQKCCLNGIMVAVKISHVRRRDEISENKEKLPPRSEINVHSEIT